MDFCVLASTRRYWRLLMLWGLSIPILQILWGLSIPVEDGLHVTFWINMEWDCLVLPCFSHVWNNLCFLQVYPFQILWILGCWYPFLTVVVFSFEISVEMDYMWELTWSVIDWCWHVSHTCQTLVFLRNWSCCFYVSFLWQSGYPQHF